MQTEKSCIFLQIIPILSKKTSIKTYTLLTVDQTKLYLWFFTSQSGWRRLLNNQKLKNSPFCQNKYRILTKIPLQGSLWAILTTKKDKVRKLSTILLQLYVPNLHNISNLFFTFKYHNCCDISRQSFKVTKYASKILWRFLKWLEENHLWWCCISTT